METNCKLEYIKQITYLLAAGHMVELSGGWDKGWDDSNLPSVSAFSSAKQFLFSTCIIN